METREQKVRNYVFSHFLQLQRPPSVSEIAAHLGLSRDRVTACLHKLHAERALVLQDGRTEIRMAMPFSAVDIGIRVKAQEKTWWPNCAWDALAIPLLLKSDALIEASCPDCSEHIRLEIRNGQVSGNAEILRFEVPAARFWDNIVYT